MRRCSPIAVPLVAEQLPWYKVVDLEFPRGNATRNYGVDNVQGMTVAAVYAQRHMLDPNPGLQFACRFLVAAAHHRLHSAYLDTS